ncbi:MAG: C40 family peptidase [Micrococcales bacterium]|nr:C40 family peptidase [Micrococcales bacterium]
MVVVGQPLIAGADPPAGPSQEEIDRARQEEKLAEASVAQIEAMLDGLRAETAAAEQVAGLAAETYNAAAEELVKASGTVEAAQEAATEAADSLAVARSTLARIAISASESQSAFSEIEPFLTAGALDEAIRKAELIHIVGTSTGRASSRFAVAEQAALAARVRAEGAVEIREEKSEAAAQAAIAAEQAALELEAKQDATEREHQALLAELAAKKNTTIALEEQAEAARIAAENEAARRLAAERQRQRELDEAARKAAEAEGEGSSSSEEGGSGESSQGSSPPGKGSSPPPATVGAISSAEASQAVVDWARQHIGKPYQWGGSGPDAFDCSGLSSQAWLNAGRRAIPRTAAGQYAAAAKVDFDQMRPGDLIFWGTSAATIHHVAIYSGSGMMVEAPRPGKKIAEIPIRWSGVYGYAGRF